MQSKLNQVYIHCAHPNGNRLLRADGTRESRASSGKDLSLYPWNAIIMHWWLFVSKTFQAAKETSETSNTSRGPKMVACEANSISHTFSTKITHQTKSEFLTHLGSAQMILINFWSISCAVSLKSYIHFPPYCVCVYNVFLPDLQVKMTLQKGFYVHLRVQGLFGILSSLVWIAEP